MKCYFLRVRDTIDCDDIEFYAHSIRPSPQLLHKTKEFLQQAITDVFNMLTQPPSVPIKSLEVRYPIINDLLASC